MIELASLPTTYKVLYLDVPWKYYGDPDKDQAAGKHYNQMPFEELAALPVRERICAPGVALIWATCPKLDEAVDLIRAWDLHYRGVAYVWVKTTQDGRVIDGQGVRPSTVKPTTELVLVGATESVGRPLPILTGSQGQVVFAPRGEHSEKPNEVRWRIEELFGDVPRLEMFARRRYVGWDAWGLEADGPMPAVNAQSPKLRDALIKRAELDELRAITASMQDLPQEE